MVDNAHLPVMLDEVVRALGLRPDGVYVDCTFGRGGHARAILARLGPSARLLVLDRDPQAVAVAKALAADDPRVSAHHAPFSSLADVVARHGLLGRAHGVLLDLGVSSPQLDDPQRGFSFQARGRLDMRMDPESGIAAWEWIAAAEEGEIAQVLKDYGEERYARRIARCIVAERTRAAIVDTRQLAQLVAKAVPRHPDKGRSRKTIHPATRTFQAIRIFINRELGELEDVLAQVRRVLAPGGRLAVVSFHSLEDRLVKRFIRAQSRPAPAPRRLPLVAREQPVAFRALGRAQRPSEHEVRANPRARSALLRVAEKLE